MEYKIDYDVRMGIIINPYFNVRDYGWAMFEGLQATMAERVTSILASDNMFMERILTHCAPSSVVRKVNPSYGTDELTDFLETISQRCKFAYWFFGHYHDNRIIDEKYILQWEQISQLE